MPDKGHMETEALLRALEKRIAAEYRKANREITRKVNAYMSEFKRKDKEWREKLENGDITEAEYKAWQTGQVMIGKRWEEMRHTLAQDYANTNDLAKQMAFDSMPDVYALNHNYATFEVEKGGKVDTSYTLYDRPTVERLIRDDPKLLPDPRPGSPLAQKLAKHKELRWEEQHVQSVVLQSILQGESLEQTAKRFTQLTEMNYRQSVRYARTATTGAQNAGRVDGYKRAEKLGVNMKQVWLATLDSRTRHEHRVLDGQEVDVGEPFIMDGFKIKYPGDPAAPAHLLYNCRCTVIAKVKGVDFDVSDKTQRDDKIGDMSYEEWKGEHKTAPKPPENVPEGKAVEVKVSEPTKGEYKDEPIKPTSRTQAIAQVERARNEAYEYSRKMNNLNLVPADKIDMDKVYPINYGNLSDETVTSFSNTISQLMGEYDTSLREIRVMTKEEFMVLQNAFASVTHDYSMASSTLLLNPKKMKNYDDLIKRLKENVESGYIVDIPENKMGEYVATHEFAHSLLGMKDKLSNKSNFTQMDYVPINQARKEIEKLYNDYLSELKPLQEAYDSLSEEYFTTFDEAIAEKIVKVEDKLRELKISNYSLENADEFLAEAFTQHRIGTTKSKYSEKVAQILDRYFKRGK
jgi:uncharacterized protein with gpF-like domain